MQRSRLLLLAVALWAMQLAFARAAVDYASQVKPILEKHCYSCHGPLRQKAHLRLDHLAFIRQGGERGSALATKGEDSLLVMVVRGTADTERMPLEAKPLAEEEIAVLARWIDEGAVVPDEPLPTDPRQHWSFQIPVRPPLPTVQNASWSTHPVDRFLAAAHEEHGLTPSPAAPKHVLLRRVYLDLVGVPPSPGELRAFLADASPDAYERVVDTLLASPRYGERWGRHWMDVWRYSDWDGFAAEVRESQPHIWRWRDWIIRSLNADVPYDEMVRQMLAGDELAPEDPDALAATGFLVRNWFRFNRNVWLEGIVEHTSKALLGITLNCARCHDHMYDPISQREYYEFRAFFEPHDVRTDRVPRESDTKRDGLVRVYDATAEAPTWLFARGNEAKPDKEHPLSPGVPNVLGGSRLQIEPIALAPTSYYPGLRKYVQDETLAAAQARIDRAQPALAGATTQLAAARAKLAEVAKTASANPAAKAPATDQAAPAGDESLRAAVVEAEGAAALAEQEMLAAAAHLEMTRAKIAADSVAFATPPAGTAAQLAREASRAERVFNVQQAKHEVMRLERELAAARTGADDAAKKKAAEAETRLTAARKARDEAQTALGQASETYTRFGSVYPATTTGRRAALARWIGSQQNPLTARVAINHIWLRHFGSPLVPTVFDFGLAGKPPTHPGLVDWLAVELMEGGWRMKSIQRLLVTSQAYRMQSAGGGDANLAQDPENVYLWRMNPRRMEAEAVRDSVLRVAGALDETMFGPELDEKLGLSVPRRSIYFRSSKEKKVPFLEIFDSANVTDCYRRSQTIVPQQALAMVNSSLGVAQARHLADVLTKETPAWASREGRSAFVAAAFERILCRPPTPDESQACLEFLDTQAQKLSQPQSLAAFAGGGDPTVKAAADPCVRACENLVHVLLNHNDFVTIR